LIKVLTGFLLSTAVLFIAACSSSKPLPEPYYKVPAESRAVSSAETSWWTYRFKIVWPEKNESPNLAVDLLLADALIKPVLEKNSGKLLWWRFHRRAARDNAGHQFSFIFYTDEISGAEIVKLLDDSLLLAELKESGLIISAVSSNTETENNAAIEAYSDKSWSPVIQKSWPSYIMGVSAFWLALIDELKFDLKIAKRDSAAKHESITGLLKDYHRIDDEITRVWQQEGQHALLHHLSGVMGYKSLLIKY
jgi:hypothetical protein